MNASKKSNLLPLGLFLGVILVLTTVLSGSAYSGAIVLEEYKDLPVGSAPGGLIYGPGQSLWVTGLESGELYQINSGGSLNEVILSSEESTFAFDVTLSWDKLIWVSDPDSGTLFRIDSKPLSEIETFEVSTENSLDPTELVYGRDESTWFTAFESHKIGRLDSAGDLSVIELPEGTRPHGITNDETGAIWFTAWGTYQIGKVELDGTFKSIDLSSTMYRPAEILRDPTGDLWVIYDIGTRISRLDPVSEAIEHFTITTASNAFMDLHIGPDGRIWLLGTNGVGFFDITAVGPASYQETLFSTPVFEGLGRSQITSGGDGYVYFTRLDEDKVFRAEAEGAFLRDLQISINRMTDYVLSTGPFYTLIDLTNWSAQDADQVSLTVLLDDDIQFVSIDGIDPSACTAVGSEVTCQLGALPAETTTTYKVNFTTGKPASTQENRTLVFDVDLASGDYHPENNQVQRSFDVLYKFEYFNDFSESAEEKLWSHTLRSELPDGLSYLGQFSNENVNLSFDPLPYHDRVRTCFKLYVNGGWDGSQFINPDNPEAVVGPDIWVHYMDENALVVTTFSNQSIFDQAFPDNYREGVHLAQSGAREIGDFDGDGTADDARYDFCFTKVHTLEELKLTFYGVNLTEAEGEQWGIDDVDVEIYYHDAFDWLYLPLVNRQ